MIMPTHFASDLAIRGFLAKVLLTGCHVLTLLDVKSCFEAKQERYSDANACATAHSHSETWEE